MGQDPGAYQEDRAKEVRRSLLVVVAAHNQLDKTLEDPTNEQERIVLALMNVLTWACHELEQEMQSWEDMAVRELEKVKEEDPTQAADYDEGDEGQ